MNGTLRVLLTLALVFPSTRIMAEQNDLPEYVIAPPENVLLVTAAQPDCPLLIEEAVLLIGAKEGLQPKFRFRLKNIGKKPILRYSLFFWTSNETGGSLGGGELPSKILPGNTFQLPEDRIRVLPLTKQLRSTLKLAGGLQSITILFVREIIFEDGTSYSAESTSAAISHFFEQ